MNRLRSSFAAKLLAGGLILSLVVIGGVSAYLLISRGSQTRATALSNSDNRAAVMREVLLRFTGAQALSAARGLAVRGSLAIALTSANQDAAVAALFAGSPPVDLADEVLVIADARGAPVYARADAELLNGAIAPYEQSNAIGAASRGATCALAGAPPVPGACGIDVLAGGQPAYAVAVPVFSGGAVAGFVAFVAPLQYQLDRFNALFQFPTAFIPASEPQQEVRQRGGIYAGAVTPSAIAAGVASRADLIHATYGAPSASGAVEDVAGSFAAVRGPDGKALAGYVGVEVPLAAFVGDERTEEVTVGLITFLALIATAILIILFVEFVVRRPIRRLERGVARIAGGDFTTPVQVRTSDELGRLASGVNRMRDSIAQRTSELEQARSRLDSAVERVGGVSRALTTTTGGVAALQQEVVRTAAAIAGAGATAALAMREGNVMVVRAVYPPSAQRKAIDRWARSPAALDGTIVRQQQPGAGTLLAFPMFYQERVVGALAIMPPSDMPFGAEDAERVLVVLANNAAIAMENARLYEQERETVAGLRQLDAMKIDFLGTVQHELRTPLTAILGLSDLIEMCWDVWEEKPKLDAIRDIQFAARNLYEIVETIIDFTALNAESLTINPDEVSLQRAVTQALEKVADRFRAGLPVPVDVQVADDLTAYADPERLNQVIRALIDNAVKFSDGKGRVTVRAERGSTPGRVRIEVVDEGIGIAADELPRIFDHFHQVDASTTRKHGGTGMGLALVKRLVTAHGATIEVESTPGAGTRVILEWPDTPAAPAEPEADSVAAKTRPSGRPPRGPKKRAVPVRT